MKRIQLLWVAMFTMVASVAFAAEAVVAPVAVAAPSIWSKIGMGALGGAIAAIVGWLKNRDIKTDAQEPFDIKWVVITASIGAILGAVGAWLGKGTALETLNWLEASSMWAAIVAFGEMVLKAIWRQGAPRINDIVAVFKATGTNPTVPLPKP